MWLLISESKLKKDVWLCEKRGPLIPVKLPVLELVRPKLKVCGAVQTFDLVEEHPLKRNPAFSKLQQSNNLFALIAAHTQMPPEPIKVCAYSPYKRTEMHDNQQDCNMRKPTEFWGNNTDSNPNFDITSTYYVEIERLA